MHRQHFLFILCFVIIALISTGCDTDSSTVTKSAAHQTLQQHSVRTNDNTSPPPVIIDPGHGGEETGAIGWNTGVPEKEIVLNIALHVKKVLEDEGIQVVMTRETDRMYNPSDTKVDLHARARLAEKTNARLFVSIHADQFDETVHGSKVFYSGLNPHIEESERLAQLVLEELTAHLQSKSLGVHNEDYIVLRENKVPAVLIETGFVSHKQEEEKLIDQDYQKRAGEGIAKGILRYLREQDSVQ